MTQSPGTEPAVDVALATPLREATLAGQEVARTGGNAIDAALAAAGVLTVAYPHNCALGGDLLAVVRDPDGTKTFFNASGSAPAAADANELRAGYERMPLRGPHTVTVPGLVGGWGALHAHGASLSWSALLQPAIDAATDGVKVSPGLADAIDETSTAILANPSWCGVFANDGTLLRDGETLRQPALARTLTQLAAQGADSWYRGDLAGQLVHGFSNLDVPITLNDLAAFEVTEHEPLNLTVRDWLISTAPPNSQGFLLLRLLGALEHSGARDASASILGRHSIQTTARLFMRATKERIALLADPDSMTVDVATLLTHDTLAAFYDDARSPTPRKYPNRPRPNGDTIAIASVDSSGRCVSLIQSLYYGFGSLLYDAGTGVILHNRGACFSLHSASPNVLAGGKRPAHTLTPVLAETKDTFAAIGTMGGEMQPQILTQVLSNLLQGSAPQDAVGAPRWIVGPWEPDEPADQLTYEADLDGAAIAAIHMWLGPKRRVPPRSSDLGHSQVAVVTASGVTAGTDPRADGLIRPDADTPTPSP